MKFFKFSNREQELKLIAAQGEAILARLEIIDNKLEEAKKQRERKHDERNN